MELGLKLTHLSRRETERYLGYAGHRADDKVCRIMDECEQIILDNAVPRYTYTICDIVQHNYEEQSSQSSQIVCESECNRESCDNQNESEEKGVCLKETELVLEGKDIKRHLEGCEKAVLLAVTLSSQIDACIRAAQTEDMTKALVMDAMASVAVEQICDKAERIIAGSFSEYYMTFRYGVGYGDFPLYTQKHFIKVTQADKRIGLTAGASSMLMPAKSVTAVIGLSKEPVSTAVRGCATCNMAGCCSFRKNGGYCYE